MAQPLKDSLDASAVRALARSLKQVHPAFPERRFVADAAKGLQTLELTPRARHIADALQRHLPGPFAEAARILTASLGPETGDPEG